MAENTAQINGRKNEESTFEMEREREKKTPIHSESALNSHELVQNKAIKN